MEALSKVMLSVYREDQAFMWAVLHPYCAMRFIVEEGDEIQM